MDASVFFIIVELTKAAGSEFVPLGMRCLTDVSAVAHISQSMHSWNHCQSLPRDASALTKAQLSLEATELQIICAKRYGAHVAA